MGETGSETKPPESIYKAVLPVLLKAMEVWKTPGDLTEELDVRKVQLDDWILWAVNEGLIEKKDRAVRHRRK